MTLDEFRSEMDAYWHSVNEEAESRKDPYVVLDKLRRLYGKFDADERRMANQVLSEWLFDDINDRGDFALALVRDLKIATAIPALRELAARLPSNTEPGAPFHLKQVNETIEELSE
ncbi:MAG: hypothetical protein Q8K93_05735 [Reyranella sp.]|uniref:hypothetical protein n=1 Tax=Reyranella sp. TaxID=1929291 RepID=UPI002730F566|nr:hypothetical protein [Reyranella sp.]MDP1961686.1 hypothetical protein [Reyranella sp.]MDP2372302.1 hypothetical protein [Reyranella sp.]